MNQSSYRITRGSSLDRPDDDREEEQELLTEEDPDALENGNQQMGTGGVVSFADEEGAASPVDNAADDEGGNAMGEAASAAADNMGLGAPKIEGVPDLSALGAVDVDGLGALAGGKKSTTVRLAVRRAEGLLSMDNNGLSDPYVMAELVRLDSGDALHPARHTKTKRIEMTLNPVWNGDPGEDKANIGHGVEEWLVNILTLSYWPL